MQVFVLFPQLYGRLTEVFEYTFAKHEARFVYVLPGVDHRSVEVVLALLHALRQVRQVLVDVAHVAPLRQ